MFRRLPAVMWLLSLWLVSLLAPLRANGEPRTGSLDPPSSGGLAVIDRALVKLTNHRRLLMIGAHPDDEDSALMTYVSRALGGEAAYLSLTRGEGGQNLIGPELGEELGVVRTGELLAARELEGTRQYFARAYDFGYTRSLEETFERWPREVLRRDAVRVARRFKPQVIAAVFPASSRAGHGQHQASAVIARDVFDLAGDPTVLPELAAEGLAPWMPTSLFRRGWSPEDQSLTYSLAGIDPFSGRSLAQLAAASRSLHRSQDMGRIQPVGSFEGRLVWLAGGAGPATSGLFEGIDTRLAAIATSVREETYRQRLEEILTEVERLASEARKQLTPAVPDSVTPAFLQLVELLRQAHATALDSGSQPVVELIDEKLSVAENGLAAAVGLFADATSDRDLVVKGGRVAIQAELWVKGNHDLGVREVTLDSPVGWIVSPARVDGDAAPETGVRRWSMEATVPLESRTGSGDESLKRVPTDDLYDWDGVSPEIRGEPFAPPPLEVRFELEINGVPLTVRREVVYRYADQAVGEIRRPLRAVEPLELEISPDLSLWRRGVTDAMRLEGVVRSNLDRPVSGRLVLDVPPGWRVDGDSEFSIGTARGSLTRSLAVLPAALPQKGGLTASLRIELADGRSVTGSARELEYPHIRPRAVFRPARAAIRVFDLELPALESVGYVPGASDRIPAILESVGLPITVLSGGELERGDLSRFDAIVVGSRAFETDDRLRDSNSRLLEYVRQGGTLLVQYQQYQFVDGKYAPFPLEIARPHGRVTDESAEVVLLDPEHPMFVRPNRIVDADWEGWIQERGLYFPAVWDEAYEPLLAMQDPGREAEHGALLVARYGRGTYVYTGLAFFRQLPAGVPGAIRLFVNLLGGGR